MGVLILFWFWRIVGRNEDEECSIFCLVTGGFWSTYWYGNHINGTEIIRGLDILMLEASEYITANEIAAAGLADYGGVFNPQQQLSATWPENPVVALALLDQLGRTGAADTSIVKAAKSAMEAARVSFDAGESNSRSARTIEKLAAKLASSDDGKSASQLMRAVAAKLREPQITSNGAD